MRRVAFVVVAFALVALNTNTTPAFGQPACLSDLRERVDFLIARFKACRTTSERASSTNQLRATVYDPGFTSSQCGPTEELIAEEESKVPFAPRIDASDPSQPLRCHPNVADALFSALNQATPTSIFDTQAIPATSQGLSNQQTATLTQSLSAAPQSTALGVASGLAHFSPSNSSPLVRPELSRFDFQIELHSLMRSSKRNKPSGADGVALLENSIQAGQPSDSPINLWVSGRYVDFENDQSNADLDGHVTWITAGASYRLSSSVTLGAFGRYRRGEVESKAVPASLDSNMHGVGAFAALRLWGDTRVRVGVLYEKGDNSFTIQRNSAANKFASEHFTLEGIIDRRFSAGQFWIEPRIGILHNKSTRDGYKQSCPPFNFCRAVVPGGDLTLGRVTYGARVGTKITGGSGIFREAAPYVSIDGIWDYDHEEDFSSGTIASPGGVFATGETGFDLGGGVDVTLNNGVLVTVGGNYFAMDSGLQGWSLKGAVATPFSAIGLDGLAHNGTLSLNLAGSKETSTLESKVRIPFN